MTTVVFMLFSGGTVMPWINCDPKYNLVPHIDVFFDILKSKIMICPYF